MLFRSNDVKYMIKVFQKTHTGFMPHAATPAKESAVPYEERKYSLLLTDDYEDPDISFKQLSTVFAEDTPLYHAFRESYELMKEKSKLTVIEAFDEILDKYDIILSLIDKIMLYQNSMYTEIAIQNYFRGKVVETVADSGLDIWIAGRGWENHPSFGKPNVHILSDVHNYADRLKCMADAKINLNVMPWTKDGSSEKIFNSLLRDALPLTDPTKWLLHNLVPEKETAYFNLNELEKIPKIVKHYLASPDEAKTVIEAGKKKVEDKWTWEHVADRILGLRS